MAYEVTPQHRGAARKPRSHERGRGNDRPERRRRPWFLHILSHMSTPLPEQFKGPFSHTMGKVFIPTRLGDTNVIDIRGWGYLTGTGSLNMDQEKAAEVQDQFAEWVVERLNDEPVTPRYAAGRIMVSEEFLVGLLNRGELILTRRSVNEFLEKHRRAAKELIAETDEA